MEVHFYRLVKALADVAESPVVMNVAKDILAELSPEVEQDVEQLAEPVDADEVAPEPEPVPAEPEQTASASAVDEPAPAADEATGARLDSLEAMVGAIAEALGVSAAAQS